MTHITLPHAIVEQALEALESGDWYIDQLEMLVYSADDTGTHEERAKVQAAITALRAALAQQAEPVAAERERCAEYLMQQAAECRENSPTRVTLESCAAVLRLGLVWWVEQQAEPVEPVAWMNPASGDVISDARHEAWERDFGLAGKGKAALFTVPLYTAPPQRKPLTVTKMPPRKLPEDNDE